MWARLGKFFIREFSVGFSIGLGMLAAVFVAKLLLRLAA